MKKPIAKNLIQIGLGVFVVLALLAFVVFIGNTNPADAMKAAEKARKEAEVRETPDSDPAEAKKKIEEMERLAREAQDREIDKKMQQGPLTREEEAARVAKALDIDIPRAQSETVGLPPAPPVDAMSGKMEEAHRNSKAAESELSVFESYDDKGASNFMSMDTSKQSFGGTTSSTTASTKERAVKNGPPGQVTTPNLPATTRYMLAEGSVIRTVFVTGVNSQNPGKTIVRVTEDVYDSIGGLNLLIPKGTQLIGSYSGEVKAGQDRMSMSFQRMVFPDGRSVPLPKMPAITRTGESGTDGEYHSNLFKSVLPSLIVGVFGAVVDKMTTNDSSGGTSYNLGVGGSATTTGGARQTVAGQVFPEVSKRLADRYADVKPYFTIDPGTPFMVMVTADFAIPPGENISLVGR